MSDGPREQGAVSSASHRKKRDVKTERRGGKTPRSKSASPNQATLPSKKPRSSPRPGHHRHLTAEGKARMKGSRERERTVSGEAKGTSRSPPARSSKKGDAAKKYEDMRPRYHASPLDSLKVPVGDGDVQDLKLFVGDILDKLKMQKNYIEKTIQNEAPPVTVHAVIDQSAKLIGHLVEVIREAGSGVSFAAQMLERDLKDLKRIRTIAGESHPDFPSLLSIMDRVIAAIERLLPGSPLSSPSLQPTLGAVQPLRKSPITLASSSSTLQAKSSAAAGDTLGRSMRKNQRVRNSSTPVGVGAKPREDGERPRRRSGSSDEDMQGVTTSSDEEVRRMNDRIQHIPVHRAVSESPLALSLAQLTMEDGRHVDDQAYDTWAHGTSMQEDGLDEDYEGEIAQQIQSAMLHEHSGPTRGLSTEEREHIESHGLIEIIEARLSKLWSESEQYEGVECQICKEMLTIASPRPARERAGPPSSRVATAASNPSKTLPEGTVCSSIPEAPEDHLEDPTAREAERKLKPKSLDTADATELAAEVAADAEEAAEVEVAAQVAAETGAASCNSSSASPTVTRKTPEDAAEVAHADVSGTTDAGSLEVDEVEEEEEEQLGQAEICYLMKLPCGHVFHEACMDHWFHNGRTCPLCRQDVYQSDFTAVSSAGPSTHRSLESGEDSQRTPRDDDTPQRMHCMRPWGAGIDARSAAPTPRRPTVPVPMLRLGGIVGGGRGSDTSSPINSTRSGLSGGLSARSGPNSAHNSARLTMSPRSAFTDAPPRSHRSQESDA